MLAMGRIYSKTGCLTCRRRRKKCDEERPLCASCRRMNLNCIFPEQATTTKTDSVTQAATRQQQDRSSAFCARTLSYVDRFASTAPEAALVGDFHLLPVAVAQKEEIVALLRSLVHPLIEGLWPFRIRDAQVDAAYDILRSVFEYGPAVCLATSAIAAGLETKGDLSSPWQAVRARYEAQTLNSLSRDIDVLAQEQDSVPKIGTLICAAHLPISSVSYNIPALQLRKLANGTQAIIRRAGGFGSVVATGQPYLVHMLVQSEWVVSLVCADQPAYDTEIGRPPLPRYFVQPSRFNVEPEICSVCNPKLVDIIYDARLLVHYRITKEQGNFCASLDEYCWLSTLLDYFDLQSAALQSKYRGSNSIQECVVYSLLLIRVHLIGTMWTFPRLGKLMERRYLRAITDTGLLAWLQAGALNVLVWVLSIGITLSDDRVKQDKCVDRFLAIQEYRSGSRPGNWPANWLENILSSLSTIVWHRTLSTGLRDRLSESKDLNMKNLA